MYYLVYIFVVVGKFITFISSHRMYLGRENVALAPTKVTAKVLEIINKQCHLLGIVTK